MNAPDDTPENIVGSSPASSTARTTPAPKYAAGAPPPEKTIATPPMPISMPDGLAMDGGEQGHIGRTSAAASPRSAGLAGSQGRSQSALSTNLGVPRLHRCQALFSASCRISDHKLGVTAVVVTAWIVRVWRWSVAWSSRHVARSMRAV